MNVPAPTKLLNINVGPARMTKLINFSWWAICSILHFNTDKHLIVVISPP